MKPGTLKAWYQASRPPFFVATLIPLVLGAVVAGQVAEVSYVRWLVVLVASFFVHLCTNLANDYFDYLSGADAGESIGGSRVIQEGKITSDQIRAALYILYGGALVLGLWLVWETQVLWLVPLMGFAFFSSLFYTAPPVRYGYHGLGEVFVGLNMGPVMVVGCAGALAGRFLPDALWVSAPVGVMVAMILYFQSLPDMETDFSTGKRTIAVRLGQGGALWGMRLFLAVALLSMLVLTAAGRISIIGIASLLTLPLALKTDAVIRETEARQDLHDRGGLVRAFYLLNGAILIAAAAWA
ncbi:MAG: 1,4-dihydroxy-2-naphthoate octaprenyltransferase [Pseudomonadota bacterium]